MITFCITSHYSAQSAGRKSGRARCFGCVFAELNDSTVGSMGRSQQMRTLTREDQQLALARFIPMSASIVTTVPAHILKIDIYINIWRSISVPECVLPMLLMLIMNDDPNNS